ncbi:hypothetical protein BJ994_001097 [Arthrobacter pigmenti]|uniref:Uncharacterized protein n=1 Tax=Arthrobacter pigmenti TaxID=271432 RepID=A0A846RUS3_9MICC|nr:hypothetical protein [Arthrobacter pigmenti]NJC22021.1 hypothetical protein [Arthrobacter pigmenti]
MDRIENLIRNLDPMRAEKESAGSPTENIPPLLAGDETPESELDSDAFSDDAPVVVPLRRRRTLAVSLAGAAAAAVVVGAVVVSGSLGAKSPLPAGTTDPVPSVEPSPSAEPTPSTAPSETAQPTTTAEPTGVPTGPPVDVGCRAQDVDRVMEQGSDFMSLTPLTSNPEHYPVIGCTDDWMAMELTDEGYLAEAKDGGNAWFFIAKRVDGQWLVDIDTYGAVLKWDTHAHPEGLTPKEVMDQRFIAAGIPVELRPALVGVGPSLSDLRRTHQFPELGVVFETRADWEVVPASQGVDLVNAAGQKVANLQHSSASGLGGACAQDPVPWEEVGAIPVSVTGSGGAEVDARFVLRVFEGDPVLAAPSLIGADQPSSGESCMLYNAISGPEMGLLSLSTSFMFSPYEQGNALEFDSVAEAEAYAQSEEFAQLAAIADSITVTD